jgi:hypothetical protein
MKWHKSPDALVQAFDHCLPVVAGVQRKAMFGYPCASLNGHLFCGLHQDGIIVHLPDARRDALVAEGARLFEPVPGEAMKEFVVVPTEMVDDRERLRALLGEALAYASSLGPKAIEKTAVKEAAPPTRRAMATKSEPAKKAKETPVKRRAPAKKAPAKTKAKETPVKRRAPAKKAPAKTKAKATLVKRRAPAKKPPAKTKAKETPVKRRALAKKAPAKTTSTKSAKRSPRKTDSKRK